MNVLRYWHTLRHLKPVQIYGRIWFRLHRPQADGRPAPPRRPAAGAWVRCARAPSMTGADAFRFLNVERRIAGAQDWNRADWPKLWLYNLHYFDDLNAGGAQARSDWQRALLARWIAENPPAGGNGWEPYPTSLRIVNWIKWALSGHAPAGEMAHSLAVQARWLRSRLEWHLLGNHLFANAKALAFAGGFFDGPEAEAWREQGLAILRRELAEQVLPDGGHFERSPMYHALILEDLLDLIQLSLRWPGAVAPAQAAAWRQAAARMLHWLAAMTHPDGEIALFNDAAFGIAPGPAALADYAAALGVAAVSPALTFPGATLLADCGYARLECGPAVLIADVGEIGPDYLPGHAHADTLSFELSLFGQRLVVNSGTSEYGLGPERLRQRGTAAHSTLQVDGADSSEVWSGFRVARRARPQDLQLAAQGEALVLSCAHDGYRRLRGRPLHRREWRLGAKALRVTDTIVGGFGEAVARYHLHPAVAATGEGSAGELRLAGGQALRWAATGGAVRAVASTWHPEFGRSLPCTRLELRFDGPRATMEFSWD